MDTNTETPIEVCDAPEETHRKLASIQKIKSLAPIKFINKDGVEETAANIEHATVQGWVVVVKKGEFKEGSLCVFFEIDSIIPFNPWNEFLKDKDRPEKPIRLRTIKMKGHLSQGLALPVPMIHQLNGLELSEGMDVTKILGVTKYEREMDATLRGIARGNLPGWVRKTDEDRIQSNIHLIELFNGKEVYFSQKLDGSSATYTYHNQEFHVCSRQIDMKETDSNAYWKMAKKYDIGTKLAKYFADTGIELTLQGELVGPSIQKNKMGLSELDLYIFNVTNVQGHVDFSFEEMVKFCNDNGLKMVPVLKRCVFEYNKDEAVNLLLTEADTYTYSNGHIGEGFVVRPTKPEKHPRTGCRLSFKVISNEFLLKTKE